MTTNGLRPLTPKEELEFEQTEIELQLQQQQQKIKNVRNERNRLLIDSDWVVVKSFERNENIPAAWEIYRQALRDIPQQAGFPDNVVWPTKPE